MATTFDCFRLLPAELRLMIFEEAGLEADLEIKLGVFCFTLRVLRRPQGLVICFDPPDQHVSSSTFAHRALLGTCFDTRRRALRSLDFLTLLRLDASGQNTSEFIVPFDFSTTCFCIEGWERHGTDIATTRAISGMDFVRKVRCLAFEVKGQGFVRDRIRPFAFHKMLIDRLNLDVSLVSHSNNRLDRSTRLMSRMRDSWIWQVWINLFLLQTLSHKELVQGFFEATPWTKRLELLRDAPGVAFEGWRPRPQAAGQGVTGGPVAS